MPRRRPRRTEMMDLLPMEVPSLKPRPAATIVVPPESAHSALLAAAAEVKTSMRTETDVWLSSPFGWLKHLPTATRAKAAEQIIDSLTRGAGFRVETRSGSDRRIEDSVVRVKFSTLWTSGVYTFQQILDGAYDYLLLFGLSPHEGHAWVVSRESALALTGATTPWISVNPAAPPPVLAPAGGSFSSFFTALAQAVGAPSAPPSGPANILSHTPAQ